MRALPLTAPLRRASGTERQSGDDDAREVVREVYVAQVSPSQSASSIDTPRLDEIDLHNELQRQQLIHQGRLSGDHHSTGASGAAAWRRRQSPARFTSPGSPTELDPLYDGDHRVSASLSQVKSNSSEIRRHAHAPSPGRRSRVRGSGVSSRSPESDEDAPAEEAHVTCSPARTFSSVPPLELAQVFLRKFHLSDQPISSPDRTRAVELGTGHTAFVPPAMPHYSGASSASDRNAHDSDSDDDDD